MKLEGRFAFVTSCVNSTAEDIHAMQEQARNVSLRTFARAIGPARWKELQADFGYGRYTLSIYRDWAISFAHSTYRGVECYYMEHSRIEYIYTLDGTQGPSLASETRRPGNSILARAAR